MQSTERKSALRGTRNMVRGFVEFMTSRAGAVCLGVMVGVGAYLGWLEASGGVNLAGWLEASARLGRGGLEVKASIARAFMVMFEAGNVSGVPGEEGMLGMGVNGRLGSWEWWVAGGRNAEWWRGGLGVGGEGWSWNLLPYSSG